MKFKAHPPELFSAVKYVNGALFWASPRKGSKFGGEVGSVDKDGYIHFCFNYQRYKAHRVIWEIFNGPPGALYVDHINGNKADNRIENLRLATPQASEANKPVRKNNTSGFQGVSFHKKSRLWVAKIRAGGKRLMIGKFETAEAAGAAYAAEHHRIHGGFSHPTVVSCLLGLKPARAA